MAANRLYQTGILLLCTVVTILFTSSCAEKDESLLTEEVQLEETPAEETPVVSKPDWDDGVITITVGGRFTAKEQMLREVGETLPHYPLHERRYHERKVHSNTSGKTVHC